MKIVGVAASRISTLAIALLRAEDNEPIPRSEVTLDDIWNANTIEEGEEMGAWDAHYDPNVAYITVSIANGDGEDRDLVNIDCLDAYSATEVVAMYLDATSSRANLERAISGKAADGTDLSTESRLMLAAEARQKALPWTRLAKPSGLAAGSVGPWARDQNPAVPTLHGTSFVSHPGSWGWSLFSMYGKGGGGRPQTHIITLNPASVRNVRELRDELAAVAEGAAQLRRHLTSSMPTPFELSEVHREREMTPSTGDVRDLDDLRAHIEAEGICVDDDADADEIFAAATAIAGDGLPFRGHREARALANLITELRSSQGVRP